MIYKNRKKLMQILGYLGLGFCVLTGIVVGLF